MRENRTPGSMGGSWKRQWSWLPIFAALGKPRDLSAEWPTAKDLASSLPELGLALFGRLVQICRVLTVTIGMLVEPEQYSIETRVVPDASNASRRNCTQSTSIVAAS